MAKNVTKKTADTVNAFVRMKDRFTSAFRNNQFVQSALHLFSSPRFIVFFLLIDLLSLALVMLFNKALVYILGVAGISSFLSSMISFILSLFIVVLIYSVAKKQVLRLVFECTNQPFKDIQFKWFYLLNLILFFCASVLIVVISGILSYFLKEEVLGSALAVIYSIIFIFAYLFINIIHLQFAILGKLRASFSESLKLLSETRAYHPLLAVLMVSLMIGVVYSLISALVTFVVYKTNQSAAFMNIYAFVSFVVLVIAMYMLFQINRLYFLKVVQDKLVPIRR